MPHAEQVSQLVSGITAQAVPMISTGDQQNARHRIITHRGLEEQECCAVLAVTLHVPLLQRTSFVLYTALL